MSLDADTIKKLVISLVLLESKHGATPEDIMRKLYKSLRVVFDFVQLRSFSVDNLFFHFTFVGSFEQETGQKFAASKQEASAKLNQVKELVSMSGRYYSRSQHSIHIKSMIVEQKTAIPNYRGYGRSQPAGFRDRRKSIWLV